MSEHVLGPLLPASPHLALREAHRAAPGALGVRGGGEWYLTDELLVAHVHAKAAGFVAADARKLAAPLDAARAKLGKPRLQGVLLLGPNQRLCSKTDTPARARPLLEAARVAVYRLRAG